MLGQLLADDFGNLPFTVGNVTDDQSRNVIRCFEGPLDPWKQLIDRLPDYLLRVKLEKLAETLVD